MFVFNIKVNGSKIFKIFFTIITLLLICILIFVTYKVFSGANSSTDTCMPTNDINIISASNYTNVLKTVHENIDTYVGMKINFTGYVYRILDLNNNQFILARNMVISSDFNYVVVGFLCEYENATNFEDGSWVNISGTITKGDYHGDMPIIKIYEINLCDKPNEEFVYPPDDSYIPTSDVL